MAFVFLCCDCLSVFLEINFAKDVLHENRGVAQRVHFTKFDKRSAYQ